MSKYKPLKPVFTVLLSLFTATAHAGGVTIQYGNGGYNGKYSRPQHNYYQPSYNNNITGPVTSFSRAYGPVTSFGLRNYFGNKNNDLYHRRYSYDENFNAYLRNRTIREHRQHRIKNPFGYTYNKKSGKKDFNRSNRETRGSKSGSFSFGYSD